MSRVRAGASGVYSTQHNATVAVQMLTICRFACKTQLHRVSRLKIQYFDDCFVNPSIFEPWNVSCKIRRKILGLDSVEDLSSCFGIFGDGYES